MSGLETRSKCEICGFKRAIDRCHIIPVRIIKMLLSFGFNKKGMLSYSGKNILHLCKNHHFLFDNGNLLPEEAEKVREKILPLYDELINILSSHNKIGCITEGLNAKLEGWLNKFFKMFEYNKKTYG